MEPLPDLTGLNTFPAMESQTLEFKGAFTHLTQPKAMNTICAFLNTKGGHLIFGVEDKERRIIGLQATSAELDLYIRWVDDIYHQKKITDTEGNSVEPGEIVATPLEVRKDCTILVVTVKPKPNRTYLYKGETWHRLGASNYRITTDDLHERIEELKDNLALEKKRANVAINEKNLALYKSSIADKNLHAMTDDRNAARAAQKLAEQEVEVIKKQYTILQGRIIALREDMNNMLGAAKSADDKLNSMTGFVEQVILEKKHDTEESLKKKWWNCFC